MKSKDLGNIVRNKVMQKIARLCGRASTERSTEHEAFVAEQMVEMGFEMLNDDVNVYAATLGQIIALMRSRGGDVGPLKWDKPNIKISRHDVAVDQDYFWNHDMTTCPQAKVQLLTKSGMPHYGKQSEAPGFFVAWAPLPKTRPRTE